MDVGEYLPSRRFAAMLGALFFSSGLIFVAASANPRFNPQSATLAAVQSNVPDLSGTNPDWQQAFANDTVPQQMADIQQHADQLATAVETKNLTQSIGRSLLINSAALSGQGTGDDPLAQSDAVAQMLAQAQGQMATETPSYSIASIHLAPSTKDSLHAYGNTLVNTINARPAANIGMTMIPFTQALDNNSGSSLPHMSVNAAQYKALAQDIIKLPAPPAFAGDALQLANNYAAMAESIGDMELVMSDPLRGLLGVQTFVSLSTQNLMVMQQIDTALKSSGIVFDKSEPGAAWDVVAAAAVAAEQAQAQAAASTGQPQSAPQTIFSP